MIPVAKIKSNIWYHDCPLGKNSLGKFLSESSTVLGRSVGRRSKVSDHSARETSITSLLNNNAHPLHVSQLSGHKNLESLKNYHTASKQQQVQMSNVLNKQDYYGNSEPRNNTKNNSIEHWSLIFMVQTLLDVVSILPFNKIAAKKDCFHRQ